MVMECCYAATNNTVGQKISHRWMIWSAKDLIKSIEGFIMLSSNSIESINTFSTSIYAFIGSMNQSYQSRDMLKKKLFSKKCWETQFLFIGNTCKMFLFLKYIFSLFYQLFWNTIRRILLKTESKFLTQLQSLPHHHRRPARPKSSRCRGCWGNRPPWVHTPSGALGRRLGGTPRVPCAARNLIRGF